jgi:hypothetical protein
MKDPLELKDFDDTSNTCVPPCSERVPVCHVIQHECSTEWVLSQVASSTGVT